MSIDYTKESVRASIAKKLLTKWVEAMQPVCDMYPEPYFKTGLTKKLLNTDEAVVSRFNLIGNIEDVPHKYRDNDPINTVAVLGFTHHDHTVNLSFAQKRWLAAPSQEDIDNDRKLSQHETLMSDLQWSCKDGKLELVSEDTIDQIKDLAGQDSEGLYAKLLQMIEGGETITDITEDKLVDKIARDITTMMVAEHTAMLDMMTLLRLNNQLVPMEEFAKYYPL